MNLKHNIKILVIDVDGTLTDGKVYVGKEGELLKVFNIKDGYGIRNILPLHGIHPVIITGRDSVITEKRCEELGISELYQGISDKAAVLDHLLKKYDLNYSNIACIGDDLNDLECIEKAALSGCPLDSTPEILNRADYICKKEGGAGAVQEFIEWLCQLT